MGKQVTCLSCGYVHFEVSRESAECGIRDFNEWYDKQTLGTKTLYLPLKERRKKRFDRDYEQGRSKIDNYELCDQCGGSYKNFRDTVRGDIPDGSTYGPIIRRTD